MEGSSVTRFLPAYQHLGLYCIDTSVMWLLSSFVVSVVHAQVTLVTKLVWSVARVGTLK